MNGLENSPLSGYYQVKNVQVVNNTLVNCDMGIRIGTSLSGATLAPENLIVANNIILDSEINAFEILTASTGTSINEGNITQNGSWDLTNGVNFNQTVSSGLLTSGSDFYRIATGSPAIDAGIGTYSFLTKDILEGNREVDFDAGAEEFGANGVVGPYQVADVGATIGFAALNTLSINEYSLNKDAIKIYPIPSSDELIVSSSKGVIGSVKIFDSLGKLLLAKTLESNTTTIDISLYSEGVYILKTETSTKRFVVK